MIYTKRVYEAKGQSKGKAFLVDRIWPRGTKKDDLKIDGWLKEVAPSTELRRWFHREPEQWRKFKKRYYDELEAMPEVWKPILEAALSGDVTFLYGSRDSEHNNAVVLKAYLEAKLRESSESGRKP
jgi:uncharacterized protein YeaO (DUF488 family)